MANEYLDKEGLKRLIKLFKNEIGKVKNKEIVSVSIDVDENGNVVSPSVEEYLSLSKRFANGEIAIIASIGNDYGFISGVSYDDNATPVRADWVLISSVWYGIEDYNLVEPLIRVYALEYDGEKLLTGMSDHAWEDAGMRHVIVDIIVDPNTGEVTHPDGKRFNNITGEFLGGGTFLTIRAVTEGTTLLIVVTEVWTDPNSGISCWKGFIPESRGFTSCALTYFSDSDKISLEMEYREVPVHAGKKEIYGKNLAEGYMSPTDIKDIMKSGLAYDEHAYTPSPDLTWTPEEQAAACETIGAVKKNTSKSNKLRLYAINPDGTQTVIAASQNYSGNDVARFDGGGRLTSNTPTSDDHVTTKKYVDGGFVPKTTTAGNRVYVSQSQSDGTLVNFTVSYATGETGNTIPLRDGSGRIYGICTKTSGDNTLASKVYVDKLPDNLTLTDDEKTKWCEMIGALKKLSTVASEVIITQKSDGSTDRLAFSYEARGFEIARRNGNGNIKVGNAVDGADAVNKNYVDGKVGNIETALDELHNYAQSLVSGGEIE